MSDIPITVTSQEVGSETVTAGFQRMGVASDQMSLRVQQNNRAMVMSVAAMSTQTLGLVNLFDRMAKGQVDAGQAALSLSYYLLNLGSQLMMLNMLQEKRLGLQNAGIVADLRSVASTAANTAAKWAQVAAEKALSVAHGIEKALSGPAGWAILAGATAAAAVGISLANQIPKAAEGGIFNQPTLALIGEAGPEAVVPLNRGFGVASNSITVHVYGASNYEEARRGARDGVTEALQIDSLQRKGAM